MTDLSNYRQVLTEKKGELIAKILNYSEKDSKIVYNKEEIAQILFEFVDRNIDKWIESFKLPTETDHNLNPVHLFIVQFIRFRYPRVRKRLFDKSKSKLTNCVSLEKLTEEGHEIVDESQNTEINLIKKVTEELAQRATVEFQRSLDDDWDRVLFRKILNAESVKEMSKSLFGDDTAENLRRIKWAKTCLIYRYSCYIAATSLYENSTSLAVLNSNSQLTKLFWGVEELEKLPSKDRLIKTALFRTKKSSAPRKDPSLETGKWTKYSKVDLDGNVHKTYKVFRSPDGKYLKDHATGKFVLFTDYTGGKE